jgi:hypothetical protein
MSAYGRPLAQACWNAVSAIIEKPIPHPQTHLRTVLDLLRFLRRDCGTAVPESVPRADFERWRDEAARAWTRAKPAELDRLVIEEFYRLFVVEPLDRLAVTTRQDMDNDLFQCGRDVVEAPDDALVARRLAWNHVLIFPEILNVLQLFPQSGARKSIVDARHDYFIFCRKLNQTVCDYLVTEAETLGLLEIAEGTAEAQYRIGQVPIPARGAIAVESYLQLSGHQLDVSLPRREVEEQLSFVLPGATIDLAWQQQLRPGGPVLRPEVGASRLRLTPEDFLWLVERRLVAPVDVGRVLVRQREGEEAAWLLKQFEPRLRALAPIANLDEFRSAFA